jgi:hypothetical protein
MGIFKTTSTNLLQLQSARPKDNTTATATDKATDSNIPNQIFVDEKQDDSDTTHTIFGFYKLLNCWVREVEENVGNLKKKLKAAAASGILKGSFDGFETVLTEDDVSTIFPSDSEMSKVDLKEVLSDMLDEASALLMK